jgi:uncharacterized protein with HEPN domain
MSEREYHDSISDIRESLTLIREFTQNMVYDSFKTDVKTKYAVIRCLEIIGEAVKRLPEEYRSKNPSIPWKIIAGMRDRLIHGYDVVDDSVLWKTIINDIPDLEQKIKEINP